MLLETLKVTLNVMPASGNCMYNCVYTFYLWCSPPGWEQVVVMANGLLSHAVEEIEYTCLG